MDKEFHFDVIYLISRILRYSRDESFIIAYCSQFVDDNNQKFEVLCGENLIFENEITQTFDISNNAKNLEEMYMAFHFLPTMGYIYNRNDSIYSRYITTPANKIAKQMLKSACESNDIYLLGITLHAYADTWAHQNFSGKFEKVNCSTKLGLLDGSIGHLEYMERPDKIGAYWEDDRLLNKGVSNNLRFKDALISIFKALEKKSYKPPIMDCKEFISEVEIIWEKSVKERRLEYKRLLKKIFNDDEIPLYDPKKWFLDAVGKVGDKFIAKHDFLESDWYKFQMAVMKYLKLYKSVITPINNDFNE